MSSIPFKSSMFVKTVTDAQFADGSISSWGAERPSEALELFRLPVRMATALISVPAQLLSLKVDYSSKAKALQEAQQAEIQSAERSRLVQACVVTARAEATSPLPCFD